jgi:hypothetical protein
MRSEPDVLASLVQLEESLWRVETRGDIAVMADLLLSDFFEFGRSGRTWQRADILESPVSAFEAVLPLPGLTVRLLGATTALLTYTSIVTREGIVEHARRSSIWSRVDGRWRLYFHQGTPCRPDHDTTD